MELYIRRLRFWSLNVCYECIVCLTHPLFSNLTFISSSLVAIVLDYSAAPALSNSSIIVQT
jgi:hypothetical protein